jgi:phosphatidylglycerophosphatase A
MSRMLAIFFGLGLLRPAPGTWASLAAVLSGWGLLWLIGFSAMVFATVVVTGLGFWAISKELKDRPTEDPSEFVIDEVAGQWLALLFPAFAFWYKDIDGLLPYPAPLAAFLFFRLFDIAKPWLVGKADRRHDPIGVMLDDLVAGVFAGLSTLGAGVIYHLVLFA